jgi:hypothetical protein
MKAIKKICHLLKEQVYNDYHDDFRELEFEDYFRKEWQQLWIGENLIEFNFVASKLTSIYNDYRVCIDSIFVISILNKNSIERTNLKDAINYILE